MDPHSLNPYPDPAFQVNPDQGFDDLKLKEKIQQKYFFISFFDQNLLQFIAVYSCPIYRKRLQPS